MHPRLLVALAFLASTALTACGDGVREQPAPDGLEVHIDQSRVLRKTRMVFLRVHNGTERDVAITAFHLTSPRFDPVRWAGTEDIGAGYEADLEFEMPRGRCGEGIDAQVTIDYSIGDRRLRSTVRPDDRYGAATLFLDRDCAEQTLADAADLAMGDVSVSGAGSDAVLSLPITITPTGRRSDVVLVGFDSTVLFTQAAGSDDTVNLPMTGGPVNLVMKLVPARCDPHVLSEDKVGTLIPVQVKAPELPDNSSFYLQIGAERRSAMFAFFKLRCGL